MCKNLTAISFIVLEFWVTKDEKLDVCNWRVFAKPVTFTCVYICMFEYSLMITRIFKYSLVRIRYCQVAVIFIRELK